MLNLTWPFMLLWPKLSAKTCRVHEKWMSEHSRYCVIRITIEDVTHRTVWRPDTHRHSVFRIVNFEHKWYCRGVFWRSYAIVKMVTTRNIETSWQLMNCSQLAEDLLCYNAIKVTISYVRSKHNFKCVLLKNVLFRTDSLLRTNSQIKYRNPKCDLTDRKL
jgi:hypothetical protein